MLGVQSVQSAQSEGGTDLDELSSGKAKLHLRRLLERHHRHVLGQGLSHVASEVAKRVCRLVMHETLTNLIVCTRA